MRRTGSSTLAGVFAVAVLLAALPARAELDFYQATDRDEVGLDDTFRLTVVVSDAPRDAQVRFPNSPDLEVLSRSNSSQRSVNIGPQGAQIKTSLTYVLVMRPTRAGAITIPPAVLESEGKEVRTEPIKITVKRGHVADARPKRQQQPDPLRDFFGADPFADAQGDEEPEEEVPDVDIPRSDSDLFLRSSVDQREVYVGEQLTLSVHVYSRVDLSSVDSVTMPKLDGFWAEDIDSPSQLAAEQRIIDGVPYRAFLLKRRAAFPVKAGKLKIDPAEADISTGFLFAGRRVHRKGNALEVTVKPLPPGAPPGFSAVNVGHWDLSTEASESEVELGQPVTVKVILEGRGNLRNVVLPPLTAPEGLKVYDPTPSEKFSVSRGQVGGRQVREYLVMPQRTGTFTLPALSFPYFDPESGRYEVSRTEPLTVTVVPGTGKAPVASGSPSAPSQDGQLARNVLQAGGVRPLRSQAEFRAPSRPVWTRAFFLPALLAPVGLWGALALIGWARGRQVKIDPAAAKRKKAKAARLRLAQAEQLRQTGAPAAFYGEVEKALLGYLEAKLGQPVGGLTREQLAAQLTAAQVPAERQQRLLSVLDQCDLGRFAPGAGSSERDRLLDEATAAMEGWES